MKPCFICKIQLLIPDKNNDLTNKFCKTLFYILYTIHILISFLHSLFVKLKFQEKIFKKNQIIKFIYKKKSDN